MQLTPNKLNASESESLFAWLNKPEVAILLRVIDSRQFQHEVAAANHLMVLNDKGERAAASDLEDAAKAKYAADLIREFRSSTIFHTYTATPDTKLAYEHSNRNDHQ